MPAFAMLIAFSRNPGSSSPGMLKPSTWRWIASIVSDGSISTARDAGHQLLGDRVFGDRAGIAVRDARRQLLERHVYEPIQRVEIAGWVVAAGDVIHATPLQLHRVNAARHHQEVPHCDRVAALFG